MKNHGIGTDISFQISMTELINIKFCVCVLNKSVVMIHIQKNKDRFVIQLPSIDRMLNYKSVIVLLDANYHNRLIAHTNAKLYI